MSGLQTMNSNPCSMSENAGGTSVRPDRDLTVVVPAYHCAAYLPVALASVLHGPASQVLIAVDGDGSETYDVALDIERANPDRVRVIQAACTRGTATNMNEAVNLVRTPFFAKLDGDDVLLPRFIETAFPIMAANPRVAVVAGHEMRITAEEVMEFVPQLLPKARPVTKLKLMAGADAFRFILQWNPNPCSSGAIYRTEAFRQVGGFDRSITWGEDCGTGHRKS